MSIIRNEIPILEYDSDPRSIIAPDHEGLDIALPERAVFAFLGDHIDAYAQAHHARQLAEFISITKRYPIYVVSYAGQEICLVQAPVGAAAAAQILDWLIAYGVRKIISSGSCGALEDFPENSFLLPYRALRDEGTSYHYAPPSRFMDIHPAALRAIEDTLRSRNLPCRRVISWSTDGFFRETKAKTAYRKSEGCSVVEMECAALAACAQLRGAIWGELLFTADTLADPENYDERSWGSASLGFALELCLDAVIRI